MQNLKSITKSIVKSQKYCNKYCTISYVFHYVLQNFKSIAIIITKSQSIAISIAKFQEYWNTLKYYWYRPCLVSTSLRCGLEYIVANDDNGSIVIL